MTVAAVVKSGKVMDADGMGTCVVFGRWSDCNLDSDEWLADNGGWVGYEILRNMKSAKIHERRKFKNSDKRQ